MIQRKQTLFLLAVVILSIVGAILPIGNIEPLGMGVGDKVYSWYVLKEEGTRSFLTSPLAVVYILNAVMALANIFMYNNRKFQMKLCVYGGIFMLLWYAVLGYLCFTSFSSVGTYHPAISVCIPFICIILYVMAYKGVSADEKLVRSMDRIR